MLPDITLIPLLPKCPDLNPVDHTWQFMHGNCLSNGIFRFYYDMVGRILPRLKPPRRAALDDHVHRTA